MSCNSKMQFYSLCLSCRHSIFGILQADQTPLHGLGSLGDSSLYVQRYSPVSIVSAGILPCRLKYLAIGHYHSCQPIPTYTCVTIAQIAGHSSSQGFFMMVTRWGPLSRIMQCWLLCSPVLLAFTSVRKLTCKVDKTCLVLVDMPDGQAPTACSWYDIWAAGVVINTLCIQNGRTGIVEQLGSRAGS